jgi:peptidoglycan/LPS O-acetylase OafA/YrhL
MRRVYFPNLNGVRFVAASVVIVHHMEQVKSSSGLPNAWDSHVVRLIGNLGVVLFFVLSGFLITYLLQQEERDTGTIAVGAFYMRRMLRIWPLYYLIVILTLFVLPHFKYFEVPGLSETLRVHFGSKVALMLLFLPNLVLELYGIVPYANQTWSVGVEEQFYLMWPLAVRIRRSWLQAISVILGAYGGVRVCLWLLLDYGAFGLSRKIHILNPGMLSAVTQYFDDFALDSLAIGGIAAVLVARRLRILRFFYRRDVQLAAYGGIAVLTLTGFWLRHGLHRPVYSILFAIVIVNLATNEHTLLRMENHAFSYLGKISYGLYMYHPIAIIITLRTLTAIGLVHFTAVQYVVCIAVTIMIAAVSYEVLERRCIHARLRFARVVSGEEAAQSTGGAAHR